MIIYDFKNDIKNIRLCLKLSQEEFAEAIGISRSNIARYESGKITPHYDSANRIFNYAFDNNFDINKSKSMIYEDNRNGRTVLYHGAKGDINGDIDTKHSESPNDFGNGFYLGQTLTQAQMWVVGNKKSSTYCFYFKEDGLTKKEFSIEYDWMLAIMYYRGALNEYEINDRLKRIIFEIENADFIIAPIADNQMYDTLELFMNGLISDEACLHALSANNLGLQYVLKSDKACKSLIPIDRLFFCSSERNYYGEQKKKSSDDGKSKVLLAITKYRKEGKMFDEIFKKKR